MLGTGRPGRVFTDAARAKAVEVRREKAQLPKGDGLSTFMVREHLPKNLFGWEIRRHGGLIVERGPSTFTTGAKAMEAGESALAALRTQVAERQTTAGPAPDAH